MAENKALDLSQFVAPGVYTVEFDDSGFPQITIGTTRLIIGFSRKGLFNRPYLVRDQKEAVRIYGPNDTFLEKRGSFFHRSLETALQAGPVLALALLPLNNGQDESFDRDEIDYKSFSIDSSSQNSRTTKALYSSFYDKERFWNLDEDNFSSIVDQNGASLGKILSIANVGQSKTSVLIRKVDIRGFNITAREFYGAGNVPDYIQDFDYMNDYFIEVTAIEGDWSDYKTLSADPIYSKYFDLNGLKKGQLQNFLADNTVTLLNRVEGSIIPDLIDGNNENWSIDSKINQLVSSLGLFATIDKDMLEDYLNRSSSASDVDMVGHKIAQAYGKSNEVDSIDFLSYRKNLISNKLYGTAVTANTLANTLTTSTLTNVEVVSLHTNTDKGILNNRIKIEKPLNSEISELIEYNKVLQNVKLGEAIVDGYDTSGISANVTYFSITDFFEKDEVNALGEDRTYLYLTTRNKNKNKEEAELKYTFNNTNLTANNIVVTSYLKGGPRLGAQVYFKPKDTASSSTKELYARVSNVALDSGTSTANLAFDGLSMSLSAAGISNVTHDVIISDYYVLRDADSNYFFDLNYSTSPAHVANVANSLYSYAGDNIYKNSRNGIIINGDKTTDDEYIKLENIEDSNGIPVTKITFYSEPSLSSTTSVITPDNDSTFTVETGAENIIKAIKIIAGSQSTDQKSVDVTAANGALINIGDYLMTQIFENSEYVNYLTKVIGKVKKENGTFTITAANDIHVVNNSGEEIYRMKKFEDFVNSYNIHALTGFKMNTFHIPGNSLNKQSQLEKIIEVIAPGTNLAKALADNDQIEFRYIVDTFTGGIAAQSYPKSIMTRLAKDKQKCLAIMNAPSIKEFKESTNPRFTDAPSPSTGDPKPTLNVQYIKDGGNLALGPDIIYSLPSEENGSKHAGFFISYPMVRENRRMFAVPPAAAISNRFVQKFLNGQQFLPVAGLPNGVISQPRATGTVEYNFTNSERAHLVGIGLNPIVIKPNAGYVIFDDLMAYQTTRSAFNNLSLRDVLITIEDAIGDILETYLFKFNDENIRNEIADRIRTFLQTVQTNGGITAFKVTMNETNNTPETIQQGFGIVDIEIEPSFPIRKFVNKVTVTGAGRLTQSGF